MGTVESSVSVHGLYEGHSLFAIIKYHQFKFETGLFQGLTNQKNVWFGILDQNNMKTGTLHVVSSCTWITSLLNLRCQLRMQLLR